ncbi:MAG TPA: histidine kinase [Bryobacteraceae bacterium]|jgi:signal transduction histidine kinase
MVRKAEDSPVSRLDPQERRLETVARRLAELVAQKDWRLLETGRFLHDDLGQLLTAAGIRLDLIAGHMDADTPAELAETVHLLQELLEQSMVRVRSLSEDLNRSTADRLGLKPALERLIEKWEPAMTAPLQFICPQQLQLPLLQGRAIVRMAEFACELAANSLTCRRVELRAKVNTRKCIVTAHLYGVGDPQREPESEVQWRILKASAALAGGEIEISVAFRTEDVTIMRAEFPTKFPTGFSTGAMGKRGQIVQGS